MPKQTYTATGLLDIAETFMRFEEDAYRRAEASKTVKMKDLWAREGKTWHQAAEVLRNTTLNGKERADVA